MCLESFKDMINGVSGIPPDQQVLTFTSKKLEIGRALSDYDVVHRSIITLEIASVELDTSGSL